VSVDTRGQGGREAGEGGREREGRESGALTIFVPSLMSVLHTDGWMAWTMCVPYIAMHRGYSQWCLCVIGSIDGGGAAQGSLPFLFWTEEPSPCWLPACLMFVCLCVCVYVHIIMRGVCVVCAAVCLSVCLLCKIELTCIATHADTHALSPQLVCVCVFLCLCLCMSGSEVISCIDCNGGAHTERRA